MNTPAKTLVTMAQCSSCGRTGGSYRCGSGRCSAVLGGLLHLAETEGRLCRPPSPRRDARGQVWSRVGIGVSSQLEVLVATVRL